MNSHEYRWGLLWRSDNRLDGHTEHLLRHWRTYDPGLVNNPLLFRTRRQVDSRADGRQIDDRKRVVGCSVFWQKHSGARHVDHIDYR